MTLQVHEIGDERSKVIVIDNFVQDPYSVIDKAAGLSPFPNVIDTYYPGLRREISREDEAANAYVDMVSEGIAPVIRRVYGVDNCSIAGASFSLVTVRPEAIQLPQRIPHFDSTDQTYFAFLHYLSETPKGGTAFYRHRRTGFERLTEARYTPYMEALVEDVDEYGEPPQGYVTGSTDAFQQIAAFDSVFNRALIYQGALLHSGQILHDFDFSPDPRRGRLTANLFLQGA